MKTLTLNTRKLLAILILFFSIQSLFADVTKTVGATGADYASLELAFDAINDGIIHTGKITLQIIDNTIETGTATLDESGSGSANYSSVYIYPTVIGKTISGDLISPIIYLNGADNVTIDGRLNATGSTQDLSIINNNTSSGAVLIRFHY